MIESGQIHHEMLFDHFDLSSVHRHACSGVSHSKLALYLRLLVALVELVRVALRLRYVVNEMVIVTRNR